MAEREPQGGSPRVREDPLGTPSSLPRQSSENLDKVPRIWEGEGSRRSEILNPINNDYWVKENPGKSQEIIEIIRTPAETY